jgi:hypothetical protein
MSGSGLSDLWPLPPPFILTIFVSFMCAFSHICNDCVVFGSICFVSCLHVLCMYWHSLSSFFCSCPAPVFRIYDPPVYSDHSCPVSHHLVLFPFEFRFVCFVSRLHVLCPVFGFPSRCNLFSICCLARLLSFCPGYVFRPVFYSTNATFFVELVPKNKVHVTPSVPFHLHCSVVCPDILSTVHIIRILCPICICEGGGGVREGHGWLRLVLWCS